MPDNQVPVGPLPDDEARRIMRRLTRRSFVTGGIAALAGLGGWSWLYTRSDEDEVHWPLRRVLEFNERINRALFRSDRLAPNFPRERAREPRVNGGYGLSAGFDPSRWKLHVEQAGSRPQTQELSLNDIKTLPRVEMVTEFKCIEGWSEVVHWAGARFFDFAAKYHLGTSSGAAPDPAGRPDDLLPYVRIETPDAGYYVGLDMPSALHAQTLLCYEMNGEPLPFDHGAPLRLVIPLKYGIKNIKRIGTILFTDHRPNDFWAEHGYDWYAGH